LCFECKLSPSSLSTFRLPARSKAAAGFLGAVVRSQRARKKERKEERKARLIVGLWAQRRLSSELIE